MQRRDSERSLFKNTLRPGMPAQHSRFRDSRISVILAALTWAVSTTESAGQPGWYEHAESYQAHLGAVPAGVADRDSALIQMHEIAPHGGVKGTEAPRHFMMAGCKRSGHEGALTAAFSAEVIENDLTHNQRREE